MNNGRPPPPRALLVPAATGPRLQHGDLLLIGGRQCRVRSLLKSKAVARCIHGVGRDFSVTMDYALAHRCRAPRTVTRTNGLLAALRKGLAPDDAILAAAAAEGHLDAVDRHGSGALLLAAARRRAYAPGAALALNYFFLKNEGL